MANKKIGLKADIEGASIFKKDAKDIAKSLDTIRSELDVVTSSYDKNDKSIKNLTAQSEVYKKILEEQRKKVELYTKAVEQSKKEFGEDAEQTKKWQLQLNRAQADVNRTQHTLDSLNNEIEQQSKAIESVSDSTKDASKNVSVFGDVLKANLASEAILQAVKAITGTIKDLGKATIEVGSSFESAMSEVAATMGITVDEIQNGSKEYEMLSNAAKEMGETTKFSATEASQALNYMALAGYDAEKAIQTLPTVLNLAASGGMDLASASDMVTDSMSAMGIAAEDADRFVDSMAKTAQKSNTTVSMLGEALLTVGGTARSLSGGVTEANTALGLLANQGIKAAEGGTKLRNIILALNPTTDKAKDAFEKLKISAYDTNGNMKPLSKTFSEMNEKLKGFTTQQRNDILSKIFNKQDLKAVNALLSQTGDTWDELEENIKNCDGTAQEMANTLNNTLQGKITLLKSALEGLGITIYEVFDDSLKNGVDDISSAVSDLNRSIKDGELTESFDNLGKAFDNAVKIGLKFGKAMLPILIDGLSLTLNNLDKIIPLVNAFMTSLIAKKSWEAVQKGVQFFNAMKTSVIALTTAKAAETAVTEGATIAQEGLNVAMSSNAIGILISGVGALVGLLGTFAISSSVAEDETEKYSDSLKHLYDRVEQTKDNIKELENAYNDSVDAAKSQAESCGYLSDELFRLASIENKTVAQKQEMKAIVNALNEAIPELNLKFNEETGELNKTQEAVNSLTESYKQQAIAQAFQEQYAAIAKEIADAEVEKQQAIAQSNEIQEKQNVLALEYKKALEDYNKAYAEDANNIREYRKAAEELGKQQEQNLVDLEGYNKTIDECNKMIDQGKQKFSDLEKAQASYNETQKETQDSTDKTAIAVQELETTLDGLKEQYSKAKKAAKESVTSQMGLFQELSKESKTSVANILKSMEAQNKAMTDYATNLQKIKGKISKEFYDELAKGGMKYASQVSAMANASDKDLEKLQSAYDKRYKAINKVVKSQTAEQKAEIEKINKEIAKVSQDGAKDTVDTTTQELKNGTAKMEQVGGYWVDGLQQGINKKKPQLRQTVRDLAGIAESETRKIQDTHSPSRVATKLGGYWVDGMVKGINDNKKNAKKSASELSELYVQAAEKNLDHQQILQDVSLKDQKKYWQEVKKHCKKGSDAWWEVLKKINDIDKQINDANEKFIEERNKKEEELAKKREERQKKEIEKEKEKASKLEEITKEYDEAVIKAKEEMQQKIAALNENYNSNVDSRKDSIYGSLSLFDEYKGKEDVKSKAALQQNLRSQVRALEDYNKEMSTLRAKGLDDAFVNELENMGIDAIGEIKQINSMTDEELNEYVLTWKYKNELARKESVGQMEDLKAETEKQIQDITVQTSKQLDDAFDDYQTKLKENHLVTSKLMSRYEADYKKYGKNFAKAFNDGFNSINIDAIVNKANSSASANTAKKTSEALQKTAGKQKNTEALISNGSVNSLASAVSLSIVNCMKNMKVDLDGDKVGKFVDKRVNDNF